MKKITLTVLAIFATAIPASMSASIIFTARCANGNYAVQTVEPEFFEGFDNPNEEADRFYEELEQAVCEEHGSVPIGNDTPPT